MESLMTDSKTPGNKRVSRRDFLHIAGVGAGAVVAIGLSSSPAAASNKMPHGAVSYQPTPKGAQRCDNCALWEPQSHCKLVQDPIAASGWCVLYRAK